MDIRLTQKSALPKAAEVDAIIDWVVVVPAGADMKVWAKFPAGVVLHERASRRPGGIKKNAAWSTTLPNAIGSHVTCAALDEKATTFERLTLARQLLAGHKEFQPEEIGLAIVGFKVKPAEQMAEALISATLAAAAPMPDMRSKPDKRRKLTTIHLYGCAPAHRFRRTYAELEGSSLARYLATLPPTELTPTTYRQRVAALAKEHHLAMEFYDVDTLRKKKAGAFLAVAQGSPVPDAGILRLRYKPSRKTTMAPIALVGKGICFDTGGINVKPAKFMLGMQGDMQGSAVALGTLLALARLKAPYPVEAWLALAMNHVGPKGYKPTDVVTASNGTTIEVIHTDAEGRMVLSDTLALCSQTKPRLIIDYATLTGTCVQAIGKGYSGAFTNRPEWWQTLIKAGQESGERIWPFPLPPDYEKMLESQIADTKQCAEEGPVDHILAARFLSRFVGEGIPWLHLDLSSASNREGLAHVPTHFNGFGVRLTLNLLLDQHLAGT
ncbi:MAG TPA: leucyl aminopeptidase family protein [Gammaproteobacteria bacterium]|nr:leucyl aminopeptidase family protein [Gammaproteobacteria bacterium]